MCRFESDLGYYELAATSKTGPRRSATWGSVERLGLQVWSDSLGSFDHASLASARAPIGAGCCLADCHLRRRLHPTSRSAAALHKSVGASTLVTASAPVPVSAPAPVPAPASMAAFSRAPVFTTQRAATCFCISSWSSDGFSSGSLPLRLLSMSSRSSRHSGLSRRWSSSRLDAVPKAVS